KGGSKERTFYINQVNDHWSSLDLGWASREGSEVKEIIVDCSCLEQLFLDFGVPKYLKIDVEGADEMVLDQLAELDKIPYCLSIEDCRFGYRYMSKMSSLGYTRFKILDQSQVSNIKLPVTDHAFSKASSGPFGDDVPGKWLTYEEVERLYSQTVRDHQGNRLADSTHWWDIHGCGPADAA
ncbi:MAG: FkbM family methyltransferase, partial [Bdellovibrionales bacterium]